MLLKQLLESAELPAEFATKAETLFEAAVNEQVAAQVSAITESFDKKLEAEKAAFIAEAVKTLDATIEETVLEWAKENAVGLDNEIRGQLAEGFLSGLKGLFEKADIELNGKDTAAAEIAKLNESAAASAKEAAEAKTALVEAQAQLLAIKRKDIVAEATAGLADTVAERVTKIVEAFAFTSEEDLRAKAALIVEAVGGKIKGVENADGVIIAVDGGKTPSVPQADTASGANPDETLIAKPAAAAAATPSHEDKGDPLKENYDHNKSTYAPHHNEDLVALTLGLLKK